MSAQIAVIAEYVWVSGADTHHDLRSKQRTLYLTKSDLENPAALVTSGKLPNWNYDGSSTNQALGLDTEIVIKPMACYTHPFPAPEIPSIVVLAECYLPNGLPTPCNTRRYAVNVFSADTADTHPWFGMEQEYVLYREGRPLGWPKHGFPAPQGPYYCGSGPQVTFGRQIANVHYAKCLEMGLKVSGTNAEVMPGQWEYQVGPCEGIEMGDHLVMSRWVYLRVLEQFADKEGEWDMDISYDAKPVKGDWNGSGLHTNFSTAAMREDGGMDAILASMERMKSTVHKDLVFYGEANQERLTGKHETSRYDEFSYGYGTRNTSVRIGNAVKEDGKGYFEDRRPAGDADPYLISSRLFASAVGLATPQLDSLADSMRKDWMPKAPKAAAMHADCAAASI